MNDTVVPVVASEHIMLITNTLNACMLAMDSGDGDAFANCYTRDGRCTIVMSGKTTVGRESLSALCVALHARFCVAMNCRHWEGNVCVTKGDNDGELRNRSYWKAMDGGEVVSTGTHDDVLVQSPDGSGAWCIKSRIISHIWTKADGHIDAS